MITEYPRQIWSVKRQINAERKTISVDQFLGKPILNINNTLTNPPLEMHAGYSRFKMTIISKIKDKKTFVYGNIRADGFADIKIRTQIAMEQLLCKSASPTKPPSIAYQEKIKFGKFKEKTPAEVLLSSPDNLKDLKMAGNWIYQKRKDHEGNQRQYEAIKEAICLFEEKKLLPYEKTIQMIPIYTADIRPLEKHVRNDGKVFVYSMTISCDLSKDISPFDISITNQYAPLNKDKNPILSQSDSKQTIHISLTTVEFNNLVRRMERTLDLFEDTISCEMMQLCQEADSFHS